MRQCLPTTVWCAGMVCTGLHLAACFARENWLEAEFQIQWHGRGPVSPPFGLSVRFGDVRVLRRARSPNHEDAAPSDQHSKVEAVTISFTGTILGFGRGTRHSGQAC
ncbi:hypothetical protein B0T26DRAFT_675545 [Lasiosphaeria miniovina]|uniref:Secreted protein n=1 Tax=Lasiosphaeria miniovina TaxID=1954250 RepID=A0AA40DXF4_9PEZI|nr:uncharacterized protein B0T26DRAFT_675545 [Lasiosphaeria miniovina]KAK0717202.1 hypothetical protein B0T26DRAFT_675545 [Lasiosphaeria miniovina]